MFLAPVETLPWSEAEAETYVALRAAGEAQGISLAPLDMMIAARAKAGEAILVTRDAAFAKVPGLAVEDWAKLRADPGRGGQ